MKTLEDIKNILQQAGVHPQACSHEEISALETHRDVALPMVYRSFLSYTGKGAGSFMTGTDAFYDQLFRLKEWGNTFAITHNLILPDNAFVFWMHQGYMMAYFTCNHDDDPPVYFIAEADNGTIEQHEYASLADFLYEELIASGIISPTDDNRTE